MVVPLVAGVVRVGATQGNYGRQTGVYGGIEYCLHPKIPNVAADGDPISGTRVELSYGAAAWDWQGDQGSPTHNIRLKHGKITIQGQGDQYENTVVWDHTFEQEAADADQATQGRHGPIVFQNQEPIPYPINDQPSVRFTSTHFNHDATITIIVEATFELTPYGGGAPVERSLTSTLKPKAYNYLARWKTHQMTATQQWYSNCQLIINEVLAQEGTLLAAFGNHYNPSGFVLSTFLTKVQLDPEIVKATAIATNTHGSTTGLADSTSVITNMEWAWFESRIDGRSNLNLKRMNFVLLYACDTMNGNPDLYVRFRTPVEGAVLGFDKPVWTHCSLVSSPQSADDLVPLWKHTERLKNKWGQQKYRLEDALANANQEFKTGTFTYSQDGVPYYPSFVPGPMKAQGPLWKYSTVATVFLEPALFDQYKTNGRYTGWYVVFGPGGTPNGNGQ